MFSKEVTPIRGVDKVGLPLEPVLKDRLEDVLMGLIDEGWQVRVVNLTIAASGHTSGPIQMQHLAQEITQLEDELGVDNVHSFLVTSQLEERLHITPAEMVILTRES